MRFLYTWYQDTWYQDKVNHDVNSVASHKVIYHHQKMKKDDYRSEVEPHQVEALEKVKLLDWAFKCPSPAGLVHLSAEY